MEEMVIIITKSVHWWSWSYGSYASCNQYSDFIQWKPWLKGSPLTSINECHLVLINKMLMLYVYSDEEQGKSNAFKALSLEYILVQNITTLTPHLQYNLQECCVLLHWSHNISHYLTEKKLNWNNYNRKFT